MSQRHKSVLYILIVTIKQNINLKQREKTNTKNLGFNRGTSTDG